MQSPMLRSALTRLQEAAGRLALPAHAVELLSHPLETLHARLTIRMDDGSRRSFAAWRCRFDDGRGPTKGGIRFHPEASADEVETLAFWMNVKCAVLDLPYGGAKGAVRVDPDALSPGETERLSRAYVRAFARMIGPDRDIPGPDIATNATIMGWMADEYAQIVGYWAPGVVTGKPVALGGSLGREDATARGGFFLVECLARELGLAPGARVAVQGFGNVGANIARLLAEAGYRIVAVSDSKAGLTRADGLDVAALVAAKRAGDLERLAGAGGVGRCAPADVIGADCDLLIPAALENAIRADNAEGVRARVVLELANGPTTPEADDLLARRGVRVVPDILANAGGVTASYFEWVQNRQGVRWSEADVRERLRARMQQEGAAVLQLAHTRSVGLRQAAYLLAAGRLAAVVDAQDARAGSLA